MWPNTFRINILLFIIKLLVSALYTRYVLVHLTFAFIKNTDKVLMKFLLNKINSIKPLYF